MNVVSNKKKWIFDLHKKCAFINARKSLDKCKIPNVTSQLVVNGCILMHHMTFRGVHVLRGDFRM